MSTPASERPDVEPTPAPERTRYDNIGAICGLLAILAIAICAVVLVMYFGPDQ